MSSPAAHWRLNRWALNHDCPEALTGDIPTPLKAHYNHDSLESSISMWGSEWDLLKSTLDPEIRAICKWADLFEAACFLRREVELGNRLPLVGRVRGEILTRLHKATAELPWPCDEFEREFSMSKVKATIRSMT